MTADFVTVTDAIVTDIQANVAALAVGGTPTVVVHKYEPWHPDELYAAIGERHLAVWPTADGADISAPISMNSDELYQVYAIQVWEASQESARQAADETGAATLMQLHNDVRARFYVTANQEIGGSQWVRYVRTIFPDRSREVRFFRIEIRATRLISLT